MDPADPRRVAHLHGGQQHRVQRDEKRHLHQDGQAAAERVDLLLAVDAHHFLLHLLRLVLVALTHVHHLGVDGLHLGHRLVGMGIEGVEGDLEHHHQGDDGPAPVADQRVQLVQQPIQRLGQDGQPAVVLDQLQPWRQSVQLFAFLRAGKQRGLLHTLGARGQLTQRQDHRGAEQRLAKVGRVGVDALKAELPRLLGVDDPGGRKVVLHHRYPAVVGGFVDVQRRLVFQRLVDVLELDLLELAVVGVHRRAGVGRGRGQKAGMALDAAITRQLQVQLGRHRSGRHVLDAVAHCHGVFTAREGVGLDQLDAALLGRLEAHAQRLVAVFEAALTGQQGHQRQMVGQCSPTIGAEQACLCQVHPLRALVKQHHMLLGVGQLKMLEQFQVHQVTALAVQRGAQHIGVDRHFLAGHRRGGSGQAADSGGRRATRRRVGAGAVGRCRPRASSTCSARHRNRLRAEHRHSAVLLVPGIPQQDERDGEHHPQDGAAHVVHGRVFGEKNRVNKAGGVAGTKSSPPSHPGWQRKMRRVAR